MPNPQAVELVLTGEERAQLEAWARRRKSAQALAQRSRIVLAAAEGLANPEIARRLGIHRSVATRWRNRFAVHRLDGLTDEPRPGQPRKISDAKVEEVIVKTLETTPRDATHWSTRSMAAEVGLTQSAVHRIWRAFGLQPHRQDAWKLSKDPQFIEKVRDVVGLYLNPPERAVVLCVDEKSQIQALDRTAPILPMLPGVPERATHDYKRAGTSSLSDRDERPVLRHGDAALQAAVVQAPVQVRARLEAVVDRLEVHGDHVRARRAGDDRGDVLGGHRDRVALGKAGAARVDDHDVGRVRVERRGDLVAPDRVAGHVERRLARRAQHEAGDGSE